jgi:hypothetical protein
MTLTENNMQAPKRRCAGGLGGEPLQTKKAERRKSCYEIVFLHAQDKNSLTKQHPQT